MNKQELIFELSKFSRDELFQCIVAYCTHPDPYKGTCRICGLYLNQQEFVQGIFQKVDIGSEVLGSFGAKGIKAFRILSKEESKVEQDRTKITGLFRGFPQDQINSINASWLRFRRAYEQNPKFNVGLKGPKLLSCLAYIAADSTIYTLDQIIEKLNSSDRRGKINLSTVAKHKREIIDNVNF